jgi:hypothetical protein
MKSSWHRTQWRSGGGESVAKNEARAARVSGGAAGMLSSTYVCRVFAGTEVTSECRASGVGGTAGGIDVYELELEGSRVVRTRSRAGTPNSAGTSPFNWRWRYSSEPLTHFFSISVLCGQKGLGFIR